MESDEKRIGDTRERERGTYEFKDKDRHDVAGLMLIRPAVRRRTQVRKESYNLFATLPKWFERVRSSYLHDINPPREHSPV